MNPFFLLLLLLALPAACAAADKVFDFETDAEVAAWRVRAAKQDTFERAQRFATSGQCAARFASPTWKEGMEQWPAFEARPALADWRAYDRLVVDITNTSEERPFLTCFISDAKVPFREALSFRFDLPAQGYRRFVIPLAGFPPAVDRSAIDILHFFTQRPAAPMEIFLDNVVLLKKGETLPDPPAAFVAQVAGLGKAHVDAGERRLDEASVRLLQEAAAPADREWAERAVEKVRAGLRAAREEMGSPTLTLARLEQLREEVARIPAAADRLLSVMRFRKACAAAGVPSDEVLIGFAPSTEKILPRDMPFALTAAPDISLSLARNEKESFQVAVLPLEKPLQGVSVRVGDLRASGSKKLAARNIACDVVGYVETKARPPYKVPYVGWWPDPILDFLGPVPIAAGDLQTFWIRVRAPKGQAPGTYRGTLTVTAEGMAPRRFGLSVRVRSFTLPEHAPLPTAITFFERKKQMGGEANWPKMKIAYADFLADYYINYDSLYRQGPPDYEIVKHLHDRGRLVAFNLGNVFNAGTSEAGFDKAIAETIARLRPGYEKAKELGVLDHAYIYGFDERPKEQFPLLERSAQALRRAFPEVLLMTTSYDDTFGLDSVVKTMDAWCPLTPKMDLDLAARARAGGKKVWWYICCGPHQPYANWFVEYPAVDTRLLMGAMTSRYRPDGFLYYSLTIWNQNKPIESGPFTLWNPVSWTTYHGDGSLFCSGPGGKPVPTIRLENYRDGLEDYAYACILEAIVRRCEAEGAALPPRRREWLAEARKALAVPETLVKSLTEFSRDAKELYAYRERLGDLIEQSGMADTNPWGEQFGVRGAAQ